MNRRGSPRRASGAATLLLLTALAAPAGAQTADARADALYREGTALLEAGRVAEACARLAESQALDPATGTLLALARCYERDGKVASAWSAYQDAEARARRQGQADREAAARAQAKALTARLPRLTIAVDAGLASLPGIEVARDGATLGLAIVGTAVPVDPGEHVVEIRAPGRVGDRRTVRLAEGEARTVSFEALAMAPEPDEVGAPPPPPPTFAPDPRDDGLSTAQITGLILGGAGVVSLGVASAFGIVAMGANDDATDACASFRAGRGGTEAAYADCTVASADAASAADLSTVLFIAGGVLAAAGVTLVVVGGDSASSAARVELVPGPGGAALRGAL